MKKWYLPGAAFAALAIAVLGGAAALGAFDGGGDDGARTVAELDDYAGDDGGDDGGVALGLCIQEGDPLYDPDVACEDTVVDGDGEGDGLNLCAPGVMDCGDIDTGDEKPDTAQACLAGAEDCIDTPGDIGGACAPDNPGPCEVRVHEIILADMETNVGSVATIVSSESVEWPNSCLGVESADVLCAEVITPGFKIVAEAGGTQVEYHTDMTGGFAIAN